MKRLLFVLSIFVIASCGKSGNYDYEFFLNENYFEIRAGLNTIETHVFVIEDVQPFLDSYLQNKGNRIDEVQNVFAGRATLQSRFNGIDLSFIKEAKIRLVNKRDPSKYQEIFRQLIIPNTGEYRISLDPTLVDIKEYIEADEVDVEVRLVFRRLPPTNVSMKLDFSYAVRL